MRSTAEGLRDSTLGIWLLVAAAPALAERPPARPQEAEDQLTVSTIWSARGPSPGAGRLALGLLLVDGQGLSEGVRKSVGSEIERVFQGSGVDVRTVISGSPLVESPGFPVVRVRLWSRDGTFLGSSRSAMGTVRFNRGREVESVHVFYPVIISTLLERDESVEDLSDLEIGRSVGRVIAHELIHAIAPHAPHATYGLMHAAMDREFLGGLRLTPIDRRSARAFHRQVTARSRTQAPSYPVASAQ